MRLKLDCNPAQAKEGVRIYAVLRGALATQVGGTLYCIRKSFAFGDKILTGQDGCAGIGTNLTFTLPKSPTGRAWCIGYSQLEDEECRVEPSARCDGGGFTHAHAMREVSLEDVDATLGLLSLASL